MFFWVLGNFDAYIALCYFKVIRPSTAGTFALRLQSKFAIALKSHRDFDKMIKLQDVN